MAIKTLLVVFHSQTGGAAQMAQAAVTAARQQDGVIVRQQHARDSGPEALLAADGYLFCTPENLGAVSGLLKDFFDRCYYPALGRIEGRPYASLICAGNDGQNAARQIERIATGWRLRAIAEPLIVHTAAQTPEEILRPKTLSAAALARCAELGESIAAGMALGIF
jgi:multimeric flavodoxin WrbA